MALTKIAGAQPMLLTDSTDMVYLANQIGFDMSEAAFEINGQRVWVRTDGKTDWSDYLDPSTPVRDWTFPAILLPASFMAVWHRFVNDDTYTTSYVTANIPKRIMKIVNTQVSTRIIAEKDSSVVMDIKSGSDASNSTHYIVTGTTKRVIFRDTSTTTDNNANNFGFDNYEPWASGHELQIRTYRDNSNYDDVYIGKTGSVVNTLYLKPNGQSTGCTNQIDRFWALQAQNETTEEAHDSKTGLIHGTLGARNRGCSGSTIDDLYGFRVATMLMMNMYMFTISGYTRSYPGDGRAMLMAYDADETVCDTRRDIRHYNRLIHATIRVVNHVTDSGTGATHDIGYIGMSHNECPTEWECNNGQGNSLGLGGYSRQPSGESFNSAIDTWDRGTESWTSRTITGNYDYWYPGETAYWWPLDNWNDLFYLLGGIDTDTLQGCVAGSTAKIVGLMQRYNWVHVGPYTPYGGRWRAERRTGTSRPTSIPDPTLYSRLDACLYNYDPPQSYADGNILFDNDMNNILRSSNQWGVLEGLWVAEAGYTGMGVAVAPGIGVVNNRMYYSADTTEFLTIPTADGSYPRKDLIVLYEDGTLGVIEGVAEAANPSGNTGPNTTSPKPPNIPDNAIALAEVWVPASTTTITGSYITDRRVRISGLPYEMDMSCPQHQFTAAATVIKKEIYVPPGNYLIVTSRWAHGGITETAGSLNNHFVELYNNTASEYIIKTDATDSHPVSGILGIFGPWDDIQEIQLRFVQTVSGTYDINGGYTICMIPQAGYS